MKDLARQIAMPLFSVIIPAFNREAFIRATLDSVLAQEFKDYEVIVVDDGSTDGTTDVARSYPNVRVIAQSNAGPGAARNKGITHARGQYVAFLDSDDVWFPWSLTQYANVIQRSGSPSFIAGKPLRFDNEASLATGADSAPVFERFSDYLASGDQWRWWGVSSFVIRAGVLQDCGGFAEQNMNGEDADLALKLGEAPGFVQITSPFTFGYREHASNVTADLSKSLAGVWHKVRTEATGHYPGGGRRSRERWKILTRHVRPVALACLPARRREDAWQLYLRTFSWHCALGRWKFLLGFPLKALAHSIWRRGAQNASAVHA